ncbi:MAG: hypothetical protein RIC55_21000 [Pirellulaceae bacterium]
MVRSTTNLAPYHGKRIAVLLDSPRGRQVVTGKASYLTDQRLGKSLRLDVDDDYQEGCYELLFVESEWNGAILPDSEFGCDCCFIPRPLWVNK